MGERLVKRGSTRLRPAGRSATDRVAWFDLGRLDDSPVQIQERHASVGAVWQETAISDTLNDLPSGSVRDRQRGAAAIKRTCLFG